MRNLMSGALAVLAVAWGVSASAQVAKVGPVNPPPAQTGAKADTTARAGGLKVGLSVKDSAGVTVGKLTHLETDASGKQMATIKMGSGAVTLEADKLTSKDGAATVSLTQTELKALAAKGPS